MNTVTCFKESGFPLLPEITIKNEQNKVVVRKVPADGEFAKFGVKEGDVIESVNGISFKGFDNNKVFSTLSVMTGDLKIVFGTGVKESVIKGKRKQKGNSSDVKEEQCSENIEIPDIKVEKEPKVTSKLKNPVSDNKSAVISKSINEHMSENTVNKIELILDNSKGRKVEKGKGKKEIVLEKPKEESVPTSLEECPECDEKFSGITALSEHYTVVHTVVTEEEEPTPLPKAKSLKKGKRKPSKDGLIKTETISVSEHFARNEPHGLKKSKVHEPEKDNPLSVHKTNSTKKEEEIQQLHNKLKDMKNKFDNFKKDRIELIELKKKMESNKDLENSLKGLKDEVDKKYKEMSDLNSMVLNTETQLQNERELNKKEKDRNKALAEEIKKLKKNQSELQKKQSEVQKKLKESDGKNREYLANECKEMDSNNEKNERFKEMEEEIIFLNRKVDQLSKENDSLVEETTKVAQKDKEVLQNTVDEKIIEMEKLKNDKSLSKIKIRKLEKQMEAFKTNAEEQIEVFKTNADQIQMKIASMQTDRESENKDLKDMLDSKKTKMNELEEELKVSNEKAIKYKRDVFKLLEKISRKEDVIDGLMKEKKLVDGDEAKKEQIEKKLKTYQDTILQKSGIISKLEEENQKFLKEKIENLPLTEEKKKTRFLEENLRNVERQNRLLNEKFRTIDLEKEDKQIKDKIDYQQDILKTNEIENKLKDLEKEAGTYEQTIQKLSSEKESLEEILKNSTMEAEEKNLLNILKSDVKNLEATNELNFEKIFSMEIENKRLKSSNKDSVVVVALQEGIRDLEREIEELKSKYKDLEEENRDTLNDQMQNLKHMVHLKEKCAKLKEKKSELKLDFEKQSKKIERLDAKNKILQKEVNHMSQLQVELKSLKQKIGLQTEAPETIKEVVKTKSKWDNNDDSDSSNGDVQEDLDWKFVNDTIDEIMDKSEKRTEVSDDETDFDSTKFIELAKSKASRTATVSNNVILKLKSTPKVDTTVRKAIEDMLETKEADDEVRDEKVGNDDLAIRRTFDDKFSLKVKNNRREIDAKVEKRIENERSYPASKGGNNRNNSFYKRGVDIDIRNDRNRTLKGSYRRERSYNERNSMRSINYSSGNDSNYYNKATERRDRDVRDSRERKFLPYERRNVNDPRRRQEGRTFGQKAVMAVKEASLNIRDLSNLEQTKAQAEHISSSFEIDNLSERSPSMDKPSTSTVRTSNEINKRDISFNSSEATVLADLSAQIKRIRKTQTEAKFEERNVDLTENFENEVQLKKQSLEDGEIEDFMRKKKFKSSASSSSVIPKFRPSKASRNEIRAL